MHGYAADDDGPRLRDDRHENHMMRRFDSLMCCLFMAFPACIFGIESFNAATNGSLILPDSMLQSLFRISLGAFFFSLFWAAREHVLRAPGRDEALSNEDVLRVLDWVQSRSAYTAFICEMKRVGEYLTYANVEDVLRGVASRQSRANHAVMDLA